MELWRELMRFANSCMAAATGSGWWYGFLGMGIAVSVGFSIYAWLFMPWIIGRAIRDAAKQIERGDTK